MRYYIICRKTHIVQVPIFFPQYHTEYTLCNQNQQHFTGVSMHLIKNYTTHCEMPDWFNQVGRIIRSFCVVIYLQIAELRRNDEKAEELFIRAGYTPHRLIGLHDVRPSSECSLTDGAVMERVSCAVVQGGWRRVVFRIVSDSGKQVWSTGSPALPALKPNREEMLPQHCV